VVALVNKKKKMKKLFMLLILLIVATTVYSQGRTIRGDLTVKGRFTELPYGTINMADFYRSSLSSYIWNYRLGSTDVILSGTANDFVNLYIDTVTLSGPASDRLTFNYSNVVINSDTDLSNEIALHGFQDIVQHQNITGSNVVDHVISGWLRPSVDDTIELDIHTILDVVASNPASVGRRIDIGEQRILHIEGNYDDGMAVDSVMAIQFNLRDIGIPADSITALYFIYNEDTDLRGADRTYFLYSEYGDNYLNGDLEVTGLIKNTPPHASMTFDDESETLSMDQNVWEKITNATDDIFDVNDASGITQAGDSLTIITPGDYMINASISFSGTTNADVYEFAVFKNEVLASPKIERTTTSTDIGNVSLPIYLSGLVAGDDISLRIRNTANDFDATLIACSWVTWLLHAE